MAVSLGEGSDDAPVSEINVTPMVDVLLCLLIIFMVASPQAGNEQIPMSVPKQPVTIGGSDPNATLLVKIDDQGNAKLGTEPLSTDYDKLVEQLRSNEKARTDGRIAISGDPKTKYGIVIRIMAAAHEAGIEQVGIASDRL